MDDYSPDLIRVLHVDDNPDIGTVVAPFLKRIDDRIAVETVSSAQDTLTRLDNVDEDFECVVSDYEMEDQNGLEFLRIFREAYLNLPFILFTGKGSEEIDGKAISAGVTDYLQKRVSIDQYTVLVNHITNAVEAAAHRRLEHREQEYRALMDAYPIPTVIFNSDREIIYANPGVAEVASANHPDQLLGRDVVEFVHPDDRDVSADRIARVLTDREPVDEREYRLVDFDSEIRHARGTIVPVTFEGEPAGQAVLVDITEYKETKRELEAQYEFTQEALDAIPDAFYVLNADGSIAQVNNTVVKVTGYSEDELRAMDPTEVFASEDKSRIVKAIARTLQTGYETVEATVQTKSGELFPVEFHSKRVDRPDGEIILGIGRDISDRERREQEQQQKTEQLEEFASIVSHDLRNPLNVVQGRLDLIQKDEDVPTTTSDNLDAAQRALDRMERIIDNMLSLTREGRKLGERSKLVLSSHVNRAWEHVATVQATLDVGLSDTYAVMADEERLLQLFENLFRNAIEHAVTT